MPAQPSHNGSQEHHSDPGPSGGENPGPPGGEKELRADARENRERILTAAREAYAAHGLDVPMATIARRAGVGVATVYRRFPTRDVLVAEAFTEQIARCAAVLDEALEDPDPWRGFCSVLEQVSAMQVSDRGFTAAFLAHFPENADIERTRGRAEEGLALLVSRAQDTGRLRRDFAPGDVPLLLLANSGVIGGSPQVSLAASRRLVGYLLQALSADHAAPLPPPAPFGLRRLHEVPRG